MKNTLCGDHVVRFVPKHQSDLQEIWYGISLKKPFGKGRAFVKIGLVTFILYML